MSRRATSPKKVDLAGPLDVNKIADDVVARILADPAFAEYAQQLGLSS